MVDPGFPRVHSEYIESKRDLSRLTSVLDNTKSHYKKELLDVSRIPLLTRLRDRVTAIGSLGLVKKPDRKSIIEEKRRAVHEKYCPVIDEVCGEIAILERDLPFYSELDRQFNIEFHSSIGVGGYPSNWDEISKSVRERDGYCCRECGSSESALHVHHWQPLSAGGSNSLSNLITLCEKCHASKHPHMRR